MQNRTKVPELRISGLTQLHPRQQMYRQTPSDLMLVGLALAFLTFRTSGVTEIEAKFNLEWCGMVRDGVGGRWQRAEITLSLQRTLMPWEMTWFCIRGFSTELYKKRPQSTAFLQVSVYGPSLFIYRAARILTPNKIYCRQAETSNEITDGMT